VELPGYPVELGHPAVLADGREVFIRPIRPGDFGELRRAIAAADQQTLYARFLGSPPHDEASIRRLVEVDYVHRLALVAFAPDGTGAGIARYEGASGDDAAEVAVAVDAGWRRVGLGSLLLRELGQAALDRGIHRFVALMLAENLNAQSVLRSSGLPFSLEINNATSEIVMWLDGQRPPPGSDDTPDPAAHHPTSAAPPTISLGRKRAGKAGRPAPPSAGMPTKD
jgi:GNAT superfamily N-acetyltransferase